MIFFMFMIGFGLGLMGSSNGKTESNSNALGRLLPPCFLMQRHKQVKRARFHEALK
jgi:hypothetical protein